MMADIRIEEVKRSHSSLSFMILVLLLFSIGFVTLMSVLSSVAQDKMLKQVIYSGVGLSIFLFLSSGFVTKNTVDRILESKFPAIFLGFVLFLCILAPAVGPKVNGAGRWIYIAGLSIQPSELLKAAVIIYMASYLGNYKKTPKNLHEKRRRSLHCLFLLGAIFVIIIFQHDFSTALLICCTVFFMMAIGNIPLLHLLNIFFVGLGCIVFAIFSESYRVNRIFSPVWEQADNSIRAIKNGSWLGCGWGEGIIKWRDLLPEAETDFIFSILAEEFGFLGVLALGVLILIIMVKGVGIANSVKDSPIRVLLVLGILFSYFLQTVINLAVTVKLAPTTGIPLPFFSQGGSSLITTLFMFGLIVHVARTSEETDG